MKLCLLLPTSLTNTICFNTTATKESPDRECTNVGFPKEIFEFMRCVDLPYTRFPIEGSIRGVF